MNKFEEKFYKIQSIETETIIIWGQNDEMLHYSGVKLLKDNIKNSKLHIIENCKIQKLIK